MTGVVANTFLCATLKVALDLPAGMATLAGTVAAEVIELERVTTIPLADAGPDKVKVPVTAVVELPLTEFGDTLMEDSSAGWSVRTACLEVEPKLAVIVTVCVPATGLCVNAKVTLSDPLLRVTVVGTVTNFAFELARVTLSPADGAGPVNVIVPETDALEPPTTEVGDRVSVANVAGWIVNDPDCVV